MSMKSETRSVQGFTEVALHGYGQLVVEQGSPERVVIEADETLLARIASEVRGRRLVLGFRMPWYEWMTWWFSWLFLLDKTVRYTVTTPKVEGLFLMGSGAVRGTGLRGDACRLSISGSGRVRVEGVDLGAIEAKISGSGRIECEGKAQRLEARITGSGSIEARKLDAAAASVHISGSGDTAVRASDSLDVRITGSGGVRYAGSPRVTTRISGSGRVRQE